MFIVTLCVRLALIVVTCSATASRPAEDDLVLMGYQEFGRFVHSNNEPSNPSSTYSSRKSGFGTSPTSFLVPREKSSHKPFLDSGYSILRAPTFHPSENPREFSSTGQTAKKLIKSMPKLTRSNIFDTKESSGSLRTNQPTVAPSAPKFRLIRRYFNLTDLYEDETPAEPQPTEEITSPPVGGSDGVANRLSGLFSFGSTAAGVRTENTTLVTRYNTIETGKNGNDYSAALVIRTACVFALNAITAIAINYV